MSSLQTVAGALSLCVAAGLAWFGFPDRNGDPPRILRFNSAIMIFPAIIQVFAAFGLALLIAGLA